MAGKKKPVASPSDEYNVLIGRILELREAYFVALERADLIRASLFPVQPDAVLRVEALHGVEWLDGRPVYRIRPGDES